jgi:hypothetical protein
MKPVTHVDTSVPTPDTLPSDKALSWKDTLLSSPVAASVIACCQHCGTNIFCSDCSCYTCAADKDAPPFTDSNLCDLARANGWRCGDTVTHQQSATVTPAPPATETPAEQGEPTPPIVPLKLAPPPNQSKPHSPVHTLRVVLAQLTKGQGVLSFVVTTVQSSPVTFTAELRIRCCAVRRGLEFPSIVIPGLPAPSKARAKKASAITALPLSYSDSSTPIGHHRPHPLPPPQCTFPPTALSTVTSQT